MHGTQNIETETLQNVCFYNTEYFENILTHVIKPTQRRRYSDSTQCVFRFTARVKFVLYTQASR
jgi:hypothetical protein